MITEQSALSAVRFGYGLRPGQTAPADPIGIENELTAAMDVLPAFPAEGILSRRQSAVTYFEDRKSIRASYEGAERQSAMKTLRQDAQARLVQDSVARIAQAVDSPFGFAERLASFWTDHFSVSFRKNDDMKLFTPLYEAEAIRPNMAARYSVLLRAATLHPAMIIYLDQWRSVGPHSARAGKNNGLNENHGRELLELHTVGAGSGYTQTDVRQASYILTGLTLDGPRAATRFDDKRAEPGSFSVLGKSYGGDQRQMADVDAFLDDLSVRPETARYISTKLAAYFMRPEPPQDLVEAMTASWAATDGDLSAVYLTMLSWPEALTLPPQNVKQPFDYIVSCMRAMGVEGGLLMSDEKLGQSVNGMLRNLGQPVWDPPSPEGFETGAASWINGHQLAGRIVIARRLISRFGKTLEPAAFAVEALGPFLSENTQTLVRRAPNRMAALTLVLASPEFNLR